MALVTHLEQQAGLTLLFTANLRYEIWPHPHDRNEMVTSSTLDVLLTIDPDLLASKLPQLADEPINWHDINDLLTKLQYNRVGPLLLVAASVDHFEHEDALDELDTAEIISDPRSIFVIGHDLGAMINTILRVHDQPTRNTHAPDTQSNLRH